MIILTGILSNSHSLNIEKEISSLIESFQKAYQLKNPTQAALYTKQWFGDNEESFIIGTSINEWCLGLKEIEDLFRGDWDYWGDVSMDIPNAYIKYDEEMAIVYIPATVRYDFDHKSETDERYLGYMTSDILDEEIADNDSVLFARMQESNYILNHYLRQRNNEQRSYNWDLGISMILQKSEGKWSINQMQYSMPEQSNYADVRLSDLNYYRKLYHKESAAIDNFVNQSESIYIENSDKTSIINEFLRMFNPVNEDPHHFSSDIAFIDFNNNLHIGPESVEKFIDEMKGEIDSLSIDSKRCIIQKIGDQLILTSNGLISKTITKGNALDLTLQEIKEIASDSCNDRAKLFRIQRSIARMNKELAYGEHFELPVRIEMVFNRENRVIEFLQLSYPFDVILENKTDFEEKILFNPEDQKK